MRPASIKEILGFTVDDALILNNLQISVPFTTKMATQVGLAYQEYKKTKGSTVMPSLGLKTPWPDTFSSLYSGRAIKHSLDWIEEIASTTQYGYCPMCGSETHKTVDHYLPRSPWAEFSFFSLNLVPSCGTCNTKRGNRASAPGSSPKVFHPYFDTKILSRPLHITALVKPYELPLFLPRPHPILSRKLQARVQYHLDHSIDEVEYQQFCINRWSELLLEARREASEKLFRVRVKNLAGDAVKTGGHNSWRAAFYRGIRSKRPICTWLFANRFTF